MPYRTRLALAAVLSLTLSAVLAAGPASKPAGGPLQVNSCTWANIPAVIAVGDVHGDYEQFVKVLRAAGAIDGKENWSGGKAHLVQTGDLMDRGPDSRKAMDLLMKLEKQAAQAGGGVHPLLGNHEAMVITGDRRYLTPEEIASFGGPEGLKAAFAADGVYGKWLRGLNSVIQINDVLYVHGGLPASMADKTLEEINNAVRASLATGSKKGLAMSTGGPLWYRGLSDGKDENKIAQELTSTLARYDASYMVVGHTPTPKGIQTRGGGRLIMIDVGMSKTYGGKASCLLIDGTGCHKISPPGRKEKLEVAPPMTKARQAA